MSYLVRSQISTTVKLIWQKDPGKYTGGQWPPPLSTVILSTNKDSKDLIKHMVIKKKRTFIFKFNSGESPTSENT